MGQNGAYTIVVHDYASLHNFDLRGPGVSMATDIEGTSQTTWNVTFANGTYKFQCDAHPTQMHGSFTVGTVTPPPAVKKLFAQVGPKRAISVKNAAGARVKRVTAGKYSLRVKDLTKSDNFHLTAPGINKKTGVKFRGTVTWKFTLRPGKATYRPTTRTSVLRAARRPGAPDSRTVVPASESSTSAPGRPSGPPLTSIRTSSG